MIVKIKKLVFGGYGLAKDSEGRYFFVLNSLPEEEVEFNEFFNKKKVYFAIAQNILKPNQFRQETKESHFLSCSCFQILQDQAELQFKKEIFKETFEKISGLEIDFDFEIESGINFYHYRNKMEFSLFSSPPSLAFFQRDSHRKIKINDCVLAKEKINELAKKITQILPPQSEGFYKSLIIRQDNDDNLVAGLFITKDEKINLPLLDFPGLKGFFIFYSSSQTPASRPEKLIFAQGENILQENIEDKKFFYSLFTFFQVNPQIFIRALNDIKNYVGGEEIVDFYSGVGTIGISLANQAKKVILVESEKESVNFAFRNILINNVTNVKVFCRKSEELIDFIIPQRTIIFDPPRSGLHPKIIDKILSEKPKRIIYLSCNPATQARDFSYLKKYYRIKFLKLYNFFPKTHHLESLIVADLFKI